MGFQITYDRLFTVDILHGYFLNRGDTDFDDLPAEEQARVLKAYSVQDLLSVVPTRETSRMLGSRGLVFKQAGPGFFVGIRLDVTSAPGGDAVPDIALDDALSFTFELQLKDPYFLNFTSLPLQRAPSQIFYFSNQSGNEFELTAPVAGFDIARAYQSGDLHVDNPASPMLLFEAVRSNGPGSRDAADWVEVAPFRQYATFADSFAVKPLVFSVNVPKTGSQSASIEVLRSGESSPVFRFEEEAPTPNESISVNLEGLEPGLYELRVLVSGDVVETPDSGEFYLNGSGMHPRTMAVVEIRHDPDSTDPALHLVDPATQTLHSPRFTLRFRNRSTFWRYIFTSDQTPAGFGALEPDPLPGIDPADERRRFRTQSPRPLTAAANELAFFDSTTELLPNPSITLISPSTEDRRIYSVMHITR